MKRKTEEAFRAIRAIPHIPVDPGLYDQMTARLPETGRLRSMPAPSAYMLRVAGLILLVALNAWIIAGRMVHVRGITEDDITAFTEAYQLTGNSVSLYNSTEE